MKELKEFLFMALGVIVLANIIKSTIWLIVAICFLIAYSNVRLYLNK